MKKLPARSTTLSKKIFKDNPWGLGLELSLLIESNWDSFKAQWPKENHQWLVDFSMKHRLNSYNVFATILGYL